MSIITRDSNTTTTKMASLDIREDEFPAKTRNASGLVGGTATEVSCTKFSDKILVTISQQGRLSQWV